MPPSEPGLGAVCIECAFIPLVRLAFNLCNLGGSQSVPITSTAKPAQTTPVNSQQTISKTIHEGKQGKHIPGHNNYQDGKSIITKDPQELLDTFHFGNIKSSQVINEVKTRVDFGIPIGNFIKDGISTPTTRGIIHNSNSGVHIVPSAPF